MIEELLYIVNQSFLYKFYHVFYKTVIKAFIVWEEMVTFLINDEFWTFSWGLQPYLFRIPEIFRTVDKKYRDFAFNFGQTLSIVAIF